MPALVFEKLKELDLMMVLSHGFRILIHNDESMPSMPELLLAETWVGSSRFTSEQQPQYR